jgi:lysozyme family protein
MTPEFLAAFEDLIKHEGGVSDDRDDPGGKTIYGIASNRNPEAFARVWDAQDRLAEARNYYWFQWWQKHGMSKLPAMLGKRVFQCAVNMGYPAAVKVLQRALRNVSGEPLKDDGVIGPHTQAALDNSNPFEVLIAFRAEQAGHYRELIARNPKLAKYAAGWENRAYSA